jgi:acetyltransferase
MTQAVDAGPLTLASAVPYPVEEARRLVLADGTAVRACPARASDAPRIRALFDAMSDDDVYMRFFHRLSCLSVIDTQRLCNVDYAKEVAFIVTADGDDEGPLIATASYYTDPSRTEAEVAYMIHPAWQCRGLGRWLQTLLFDYGKRRGVECFVAEVLRTNGRMSKLARGACADVRVESDGDVLTITMRP